MLKYSKFAVLAMLGVIATSTAYAESKSAATVNGVAIPQARLEMRIKAAIAQGQPDSAELRNAVRDDLITMEILAQAANKKGLNKQAFVKEQQAFLAQQIEISKQTILAQAFIQDYLKANPISDDVLKQEYERVNKLRGNKEYKVSHILVKTESEAKTIAEQLKNSKFEDVAMDKSQDPGSSVKGGDLGWASPADFVKPFSEAMVALGKGQTSAPVQSQFGWHIIKLEDSRDAKAPSFEEAKPSIIKHMQQQLIQKTIGEQRAKAVIK